MNYLVDRNYIAKEIYGGLAIPMWIGINPIFPTMPDCGHRQGSRDQVLV